MSPHQASTTSSPKSSQQHEGGREQSRPLSIYWSLLVASLDQLRRNRRQIPEQTPALAVRSCGEVHLRRRRVVRIETRRTDITRAQGPYALNRERLAIRILHQPVEPPCCQIICSNQAGRLRVSCIRKLSDKQVVAEASEVLRRQRHTPRNIEPWTMLQTPQKPPVGIEDIDVTKTWTCGRLGLSGQLERKRDDDVVTNRGHVERHIVPRQFGIFKGFAARKQRIKRQRIEVAVASFRIILQLHQMKGV